MKELEELRKLYDEQDWRNMASFYKKVKRKFTASKRLEIENAINKLAKIKNYE